MRDIKKMEKAEFLKNLEKVEMIVTLPLEPMHDGLSEIMLIRIMGIAVMMMLFIKCWILALIMKQRSQLLKALVRLMICPIMIQKGI